MIVSSDDVGRVKERTVSVVVTGVSGRIGRHLGRFLRASGYEVIGLDIVPPPHGVCDEFHEVDILLLPSTDPLPRNRRFNVLVHLAAIWPSAESIDEPMALQMMEVNVQGTFRTLRWAIRKGIDRVVFMSSESVLGFTYARRRLQPRYVPIDEQHPLEAHDPYGLSKRLGEIIAQAFHLETGVTVFCLRPPWVWVPEEAELYVELVRHPECWVHGLWAYIAVEDLCDAVERAIRYDGPSGYYEFFVTASDVGVPIPTRWLLEHFYGFTGPYREDFSEYGAVISSRAVQEFLGWRPRWDWRSWLSKVLGVTFHG